jgi:hypothetical protein
MRLDDTIMNDRRDTETQTPDDDISWDELLRWLEFGGWTALALTPMLYFVNGPAVSQDQFVVRCGIVTIASGLGIGLSSRRFLHSW